MIRRSKFAGRLVILSIAAAASGSLNAQTADYPAREIEFVVSFPAGGPADGAARALGPLMSAALRQPVLVINKPGGGGAVGSDYAARARPDGHSVYVSTNSVLTISPHLKKLSYKVADFTPIGAFAVDLGVVAVRNTAPARTLEEFVDYVRRNPGKLSYGSAGFGTVSFFSMELFKAAYSLDLLHVPFQGTGPVKTALMGGHVLVSTSGFGSLAPLIRSGDLIALATTSPTRVAAFPNVPTMAENGFPDASLNIWMALYAPAKTPKPVTDLLVRTLAQVAREPALAAGLEKAGMHLDYRDPAETLALLERESRAVARIVEKLDLPRE
ncbi:MAG: tripartite tricarboxylate transporter substrate binding protein [Betaproteobacteria bacterium]|nr:tripartite tricarboxylate transporter substrate binding protein [Betaproteobacteria bacterium]